jgi:hypothetical protein
MMRYARDTRRSGIAMARNVSDVNGRTYPPRDAQQGWTDLGVTVPRTADPAHVADTWDGVTVDARNVRHVAVEVANRTGVRPARVCGGCGMTRSASGVCYCLV